jgi:hypothetical protein
MEKQILDLLLEMNDRLKRVEEIVNRIEFSQTEDVVGLLKVTKRKQTLKLII